KQPRSLPFFEAHFLHHLEDIGDTLLLGLLWRWNDGACAIACTQAEQQVAEGRLNLRKLQAFKLRFKLLMRLVTIREVKVKKLRHQTCPCGFAGVARLAGRPCHFESGIDRRLRELPCNPRLADARVPHQHYRPPPINVRLLEREAEREHEHIMPDKRHIRRKIETCYGRGDASDSVDVDGLLLALQN